MAVLVFRIFDDEDWEPLTATSYIASSVVEVFSDLQATVSFVNGLVRLQRSRLAIVSC